MPAEEDETLALHHVALIKRTGIERGTIEGKDKNVHPAYKQKKARMEEQAIKFVKAGQLPMEGQGENEGLERPQGWETIGGMKGRRGVKQQESMIAKIHQKGTEECCNKKEEGYVDKEKIETNSDVLTWVCGLPIEKRGHTSN